MHFNIYENGEKWCRNQDSNPGPDDYKSTALPTELLRRTLFSRFYYILIKGQG